MKWKQTWELPSIPDPVFWPEVGRRRGQAGGKPKTLRPCEFCGEEFGARDMQFHLPRCDKRPNSRKVNDKGKTHMATSVVRSLPGITDPHHGTETSLASAYTASILGQRNLSIMKAISDIKVASALRPLGEHEAKNLQRLEATLERESSKLEQYRRRLEKEFEASVLS